MKNKAKVCFLFVLLFLFAFSSVGVFAADENETLISDGIKYKVLKTDEFGDPVEVGISGYEKYEMNLISGYVHHFCIEGLPVTGIKVTSIEDEAFMDFIYEENELGEKYLEYYLVFTDNVEITSIGKKAFFNSFFDGIFFEMVAAKNITTIGDSAFENSLYLKDFDLSFSNVAELGDRVFYNCVKLESLDLPASLTKIRTSALGVDSDKNFDGSRRRIDVHPEAKNLSIYCYNGEVARGKLYFNGGTVKYLTIGMYETEEQNNFSYVLPDGIVIDGGSIWINDTFDDNYRPTNSDGEKLYRNRIRITSENGTPLKNVSITYVVDGYGTKHMTTDDEGYLNLWLPAGTKLSIIGGPNNRFYGYEGGEYVTKAEDNSNDTPPEFRQVIPEGYVKLGTQSVSGISDGSIVICNVDESPASAAAAPKESLKIGDTYRLYFSFGNSGEEFHRLGYGYHIAGLYLDDILPNSPPYAVSDDFIYKGYNNENGYCYEFVAPAPDADGDIDIHVFVDQQGSLVAEESYDLIAGEAFSVPLYAQGIGFPDDVVWELVPIDLPADASLVLSEDPGEQYNLSRLLEGKFPERGTYYAVLSLEDNEILQDFKILTFSVKGAECAVTTVVQSQGGTVSGDGIFETGDSVTLAALPDEGYRFVGWYNASGVQVSSDNPYTFTAAEDVTITAVFEKAPVLVDPAVVVVEDLIAAIGDVTVNSKTAIDVARAAYDKLSDEQKSQVENIAVLTAAETKYEEVKAAADKAAADAAVAAFVEDLIAAIGDVTVDSEGAIMAARVAYDQLSEEQQALVKNVEELEVAEEKYEELTGSESPIDPDTPVNDAESCIKDDDCPMTKYSDLYKDQWYHDAVHYVLAAGLMNGMGETIFAPEGTTTRAQVVTILWRLAGEPVVEYELTFGDVAENTWYTEAIRWAAQNGIVEGYDAQTFGVDDPVTRQQLAVIFWRYEGSPQSSHSISSYLDAEEVSDYAKTAMAWANEVGLINGHDNNTLAPADSASRAQVAQILFNYAKMK